MLHAFSRTELLIGEAALEKLKNSRVAIFGIGGVGTFVVEALVRSGVGKFMLIDNDEICLTNLNRQIHATHKTIGLSKVEVMKERILDINPEAEVLIYQQFYLPSQAKSLVAAQNSDSEPSEKLENALTWEAFYQDHLELEGGVDYIVDAIDTVSGKIDLIVNAKMNNIPIISSMGAGNKLNPAMFEVADLSKTSVCPLARVMRQEMKKRGINGIKVVYSKEEPLTPKGHTEPNVTKRQIPGSISFVPSVAGLIAASEVVKDLIK